VRVWGGAWGAWRRIGRINGGQQQHLKTLSRSAVAAITGAVESVRSVSRTMEAAAVRPARIAGRGAVQVSAEAPVASARTARVDMGSQLMSRPGPILGQDFT
jgi:hypothetical protein